MMNRQYKSARRCANGRRPSYIDAGYVYRKPTPAGMTPIVMIALLLFGIAFLIWLANTPTGEQFSIFVAERILGLGK